MDEVCSKQPPGMRSMSALRAVIADLETKRAVPDEVDVRFDRPFLFAIRDVSTGNWTYAGPAAGSTNYTITAVAGGPCV